MKIPIIMRGMAVKTCRLCGRPLSRIRVGGDEEFCSREHRNQFRLRSSMGRLLEANKVASVMRRRETLRQIPASQLLRSTEVETRPGMAIAPFRTDRAPLGVITTRAVRFDPDVARRDEFTALSPRDVGPRQARSPEVVGHRIFRPLERSAIPGHEIASKPVNTPHAGLTKFQIPRVGPVAQTRESRVVLHVAEQPRFERHVALQPSKASRRGDFRPSPAPAVAACSGKIRMCAAQSPSRKLQLPSHTVELETKLPRLLNPLPTPRAPQVRPVAQLQERFWRTEAQLSTRTLDSSPARPGLEAKGPVDLLLAPIKEQGTHRFSAVEFVQPMVRLNGMSATMYRPVPEARLDGFLSGATLIEDDFSNGADLWAGDTTEWNLDAAGARPAGLALFKPSLGMSEYEFEFLARIESKAVTCIFRALNPSNYQKVTIRRSATGEHELRRSVVIGGVEEGATVVPVTGLPAKQSALTVKVRARRTDFSVLVEGQTITRWTDGRLPLGGAGFTAGRGERARIYCVRLTLFESAKSPVAPIRRLRSLS
jgi:hypothetical protein